MLVLGNDFGKRKVVGVKRTGDYDSIWGRGRDVVFRLGSVHLESVHLRIDDVTTSFTCWYVQSRGRVSVVGWSRRVFRKVPRGFCGRRLKW